MNNLSPAMLMIKEKMKGVWSSGDFGVVAKIIEDEEQEFLNLLNIPRGSKFLMLPAATAILQCRQQLTELKLRV